MGFLQVQIDLAYGASEIVGAVLYGLGHASLEIVDDMQDVREFLEESTKYWDYVDYGELQRAAKTPCIKLYLADNEHGQRSLLDIREAMDRLRAEYGDSLGTLTVSSRTIVEEDWAENWKQYFTPIQAGENVLIWPAWEKQPPPRDKIVYLLDNSSIFGTGQHQTTQLCIAAIEKHMQEGSAMLDVGCGSGILSIVGLKLGAGSALAVDIEQHAGEIVAQNARLNGVGEGKLRVLVGDVLEDGDIQREIGTREYGLVAANIVADVVIALCPQVEAVLSQTGVFVASGIIEERLGDVEAALQNGGFEIVESRLLEGWAAVVARRLGKQR
ncbi:MAG: 50S ribosomal protein L11 methyltransferase [Christensenellales bacterium]|jgi:ribosomal protein L11 methyltransferase